MKRLRVPDIYQIHQSGLDRFNDTKDLGELRIARGGATGQPRVRMGVWDRRPSWHGPGSPAGPCPVSCPRATYQRRQPEQTVLYRAIATHLPTFLAHTAAENGTGSWPAFVRREFEAYL